MFLIIIGLIILLVTSIVLKKNPQLVKSSYEILKLRTLLNEETDKNKIEEYAKQLKEN